MSLTSGESSSSTGGIMNVEFKSSDTTSSTMSIPGENRVSGLEGRVTITSGVGAAIISVSIIDSRVSRTSREVSLST